MKEWFIRHCPDLLFPLVAKIHYGSELKIEMHSWLLTRDEVSLVSPTPKFVSFGMTNFKEKFERFFQIEKGDVCVDVGACIGDTTIPMVKKAEAEGFVMAIEPEPRNLEYLQFNGMPYPNVETIPKAVSNHEGTQKLYLHNAATGHSLIPLSEDVGCITVPCDTLDNILADLQVDFLKVDVQGAEIQALEGAHNTLQTVKKLVVETHFRYDQEKRTYPKVVEMLEKLDFSKVKFCLDNGLVYAWKS